jgi:hypothetical protein
MTRLLHRARWQVAVRLHSGMWLYALIACAPACSSDARPPSLIDPSDHPGASGSSGSSSAEGGSSDTAGETGEEAGDSGAGGEGGESGEGGGIPALLGGFGGRPALVPAVCQELVAWSGSASVSGVSNGASETLLALTPDELDLAFLRDGALYVAHRGAEDATFSSGAAVTIPTGWSASHGASLSADGKRLLLVSDPDQKKLGELSRLSRDTAFSGTIDTSAFTAINQDSDFTRRVYASPTISAGDDQLFFNSSLDTDSTIVFSSRAGTGAWSPPKTLSDGIFDGAGGERRLPTGVSADGRTLFYFNEQSGEEEARWRATNSATSPLYDMLSLGMRRGAAPNSACNRLYSTVNGDVVVEKD